MEIKAMKKCPVCGVEHSDIISVCSICGSPLTSVANVPDAPAPEPASAPAPAAPAEEDVFSTADIQAAVSSVVNATVEEHKAAPSAAEDFDDDSPFVVNAMKDSAPQPSKAPERRSAPRRAASGRKTAPKKQPAPKSEAANDAIDTTAVAAVSAQKVYEATQNAINARNAQAAANPQKPQEETPEQVEWSQRKHKRKEGSNGPIIAACALVLLLIIALLIFAVKMIFGGDNGVKPNDTNNNSTVSDNVNPDSEDQQNSTTILPETDPNAEDNTDDPANTEDPDANTPDDNENTDDPDASVIHNDNANGDENTPADDNDESDSEEPADNNGGNDSDEPQPVVVPSELPAITEKDDTVYATAAVNVRDYPSAQTSNVINVLSAGQAVKRTGVTSTGWSRVDLGNGTIGYVSNSYLSTSKDGAQNDNNNSGNSSVAYTNNDVNVRKEPGGDIIGTLAKGTEVKTGAVSGNWTQVTAGDLTGYVYSSYLTASGNSGNSGNSEQPKVTIKETGDTVYATAGVNVRDYPSSSTGNVVATLTKGQAVERIGTTANGWSQIKVGSTTGYVYSDYLSTSKDGGSGNNNNSGSGKSGGYILPDSGTRNYTKDELKSLSKSQLRLARNEIYARHGRKFNTADLREYFESKSWYSGTIDAATFDANVSSYLNSYELANLKLIQELENG